MTIWKIVGALLLMNSHLAILSQGKLLLLGPDTDEEPVISDFAENLKKRLRVSEDRARLRTGTSAAFMRGGLPMAPAASVEDTFRAEFTCVAPGTQPGEICYAIDAGEVRGLFSFEVADKYEQRLLHGPDYRFAAISTRDTEDGPQWLVAAAQDHGVSRIGMFIPKAGGCVREITEGDSIDSYPAWHPGDANRLVFQTCGVARHHRTNAWLGLGPASIQRVNLRTGDMEPLIEDAHFDYLCPSFAPDGMLHYLKRPYQPFHQPSIWRFLLDILLFPWRLLRAIFAFLNVFSMFFSGKPLQTAGTPPPRDGPDPKSVFLYGRWVNMEKQMRDASVDELVDLVPKNWELIARQPDGSEKVVCSNVMAYALGKGGEVYYSNGKGVFVIRKPGDQPVSLSKRKLVTCLAEVPA